MHHLLYSNKKLEIVSEESVLRVRDEKFAEYEIGGVAEYWKFMDQ